MRKVYEYRNKAEAEIVIVSASGRTKYKFKFTGGVMDTKNKVHAKHTTDNPIMQRVLEKSEYFNKTIFCVGTFGAPIAQTPAVIKKTTTVQQPAPAPAPEDTVEKPTKTAGKRKTAKSNVPAENTDTEAPASVKVMEDVTDTGIAASILLGYDGVTPTDIESLESILKKAKELNISFPNLK